MIYVRPPAVAGMFYPAQPDTLRKDIHTYLDAATPPTLAHVRAIIAPHAGYVYSGGVAGFAYKILAAQATPPKRIYLLGPSHRVPFRGVALSEYTAFKTPLGDFPLDTAQIERLAEFSTLFTRASEPHAPEHCLEVQIPFLQIVCPATLLVPMLFGNVNPHTVGQLLSEVLEPDDLIVISSDLSHYHENKTAHQLDHQFLDALLAGDETGVLNGEACGQAPAAALLVVAKTHGWQPHLLDYRTSGDVTGDMGRGVVGYGAVAYTAPITETAD
ncbi:MAG: AmmeMemoRadiSam system protein B [Anaerolineae bacterium]|nr:AmmeMemoRadiSam system protein B [Anaerolineae bacterium]